ncbi:hypothetical protein CMZ82_05725 [Lysobacteraceae bacterium NML93-0792]|nr:hypothetical protein CMZ82_05725 [Xanthomonadaceae bacterium NML93-0792]PBS16827.1 hypothetical protein CMZ81_03825 [Xanthomonadaceae bacterium NML93-0793]PBS19424.1 hypothetical protein CMZ80_06945 [Xanthomonadaceae bacterium NML93-0831]
MSLLADTACAHEPAGHQRASVPGRAPSPISVPLDAPSRATLQRHPVPVPGDGRTLQCEGVALSALLQVSGAMPDTPLDTAHLDRYVLVSARTGERAVFSLGELDVMLGNRAVYLLDRCEGAPLDDDDGPLRLLVADDSRPARSLRQIDAITVVAAP